MHSMASTFQAVVTMHSLLAWVGMIVLHSPNPDMAALPTFEDSSHTTDWNCRVILCVCDSCCTCWFVATGMTVKPPAPCLNCCEFQLYMYANVSGNSNGFMHACKHDSHTNMLLVQ